MQQGPDQQLRCMKCNAPVGQSVGRCPFCGADLPGPAAARPFQPAVIGMSDAHRERMAVAKKKAVRAKQMGAAVFAAAALLLIAVGGTAAFFITRKPAVESPSAGPTVAPTPTQPERAPLNINGVDLGQGPEIDPTDVIHLVRARVGDKGTEVKLLDMSIHRARLGKVNLDDPEAAVVYRWLVIRRDVRAAKVDELNMERVQFSIRADAPPIEREPTKTKDTTVAEPVCVWSAAWRAAIASGLSEKDPLEVTYGPNPKKTSEAVWTFAVRDRPETIRVIDGENCAIKLGER